MPDVTTLRNRSRLLQVVSIIGVAASIAAILSLYFQVKKPKRELEATMLNAEHVTALPKVSGLVVDLTYQNKKIADFWIARVRVRNTGDVTLIGRGSSKNILSEGITTQLPPDFEIVDIQPKEALPTSGFKYSARSVATNAIEIDFTQWRIGEEAIVTAYLTRKPGSEASPQLSVGDREIVDGDVRIATASEVKGRVTLMETLPPAVARVSRWMAIFLQVCVMVVAITVLVPSWIEYVKYRRWRTNHLTAFEQKLKQQFSSAPAEVQAAYIANPQTVPDNFWEPSTLPKPTSPLFSTWQSGIITSVISIFFLLSSLASLAALLSKEKLLSW